MNFDETMSGLVKAGSKDIADSDLNRFDPVPAGLSGVILLVDDDPYVISALKRVLRYSPYQVITAGSASTALAILEDTPVEVAVLDFWMPGQNGLWLAKVIKERYPLIVQIMLTGCAELSVVREAAIRGVIYRYLLKPWDRVELLKTLSQALEAAAALIGSDQAFEPSAAPSPELAPLAELSSRYLQSDTDWGRRMLDLARAVDCRDPCTLGHSSRVSVLSVWLAQAVGLKSAAISELLLGSLLHDVGKVSVPDSILFKPAKLTTEEMSSIKSHTVVGWQILLDQGAPGPIAAIARRHHEDFDGSGYPDGLAGHEIPLAARIVRLADTFDAMHHKRPYRDGLPLDFILKNFRELEGRQFDPDLVGPFIALAQEPRCRLLYQG